MGQHCTIITWPTQGPLSVADSEKVVHSEYKSKKECLAFFDQLPSHTIDWRVGCTAHMRDGYFLVGVYTDTGDEVISSRAKGKVKLARPHVWKKA